jgi:hypothetical protein
VFLLDIIADSKSSKEVLNLAHQVLLLLGLARNSAEDLLILSSLLQKDTSGSIDLREGLRILRK